MEEAAVTCAHTGRLGTGSGWVPETDLDALVRAQVASRDELALAGRECQHGLALRHVEC